ncbi:MAG: sigma-70 family RNA polymerase sigma factor [Chitinivibrionales bacterium]|nr:sigma-70 family RNA polymerase sigma factor [Chitinivibrionales bacterium]
MAQDKNETPDNEYSTEQIIEGCRAQNSGFQRILFKKYKHIVYTIIAHYLGPHYDIDDIVQQVFINVFRSLNNFKGLSSLDTWIYRITHKVCIDQIRKKYRKRVIAVHSNSEMLENMSAESCGVVSRSQEDKELSEQIYSAMNKLSADKRMVITLFEMEGFSIEDIAQILKKPVGTVKSRLFHGRKELANHLRKYL